MNKILSPSQHSLKTLLELAGEKKVGRQLNYIYKQVPSFPCIKCGLCCFDCCEVYYLEYLNIHRYLKRLPADLRERLLERVVAYEFLNLVSIDLECPFLVDNECTIYNKRPLSCRLFGLYPEKEYKARREESRDSNRELAKYYLENFGIKLPELVITHDINQCEYNHDENGNLITLSLYERSRLQGMVLAIEDQVLPQNRFERPEGVTGRFSYFFLKNFFGEGELFAIRLALMRDFLQGNKTDVIVNLIQQYKVKF